MIDLLILITTAMVFCTACWTIVKSKQKWPLLQAMAAVGMVCGFGIACASLYQMATRTLL